jgi:hypothetical protein
VSYADKLYNLRYKLDNLRNLTFPSPEEEEQRVQEYFQWSGKVLRNMLGANDKLEAELEKVLSSRGVTLYP